MASDAIRNCPLCGEKGAICWHFGEAARLDMVRCEGCGLCTTGHASDDEAAAEWNRLAMLPNLEKVVRDMLSGLAYIRDANSVPYGFGLKRLEDTGKAALAEAPEPK